MRKLTEHDHNVIQSAIDNSDGIFECVEEVIDYVLEQHPEIAETLNDNDYLTWRVVLDQEIVVYDFDPDARGPEPLLDKP